VVAYRQRDGGGFPGVTKGRVMPSFVIDVVARCIYGTLRRAHPARAYVVATCFSRLPCHKYAPIPCLALRTVGMMVGSRQARQDILTEKSKSDKPPSPSPSAAAAYRDGAPRARKTAEQRR